MKTLYRLKQHCLFFGLLFFFSCSSLWSQNPSGLSINWNVEVGCQDFSQDIRDPGKPIYIEQIVDGSCVKVCEKSRVTYTLSGNLGVNPATIWTVTGGSILSQNTTTCTVLWGIAGSGTIGFSITTPSGEVSKTICIEKINIPIASFSSTALLSSGELEGTRPQYYACVDQTIYFTNTSLLNGSAQLLTYLWDFGDGTTSSLPNPSHVYTEEGSYTIYFTVTNECGCKSSRKMQINIKTKGFDILCPGVVCEGQAVTYSLPFEGQDICYNHYNWSLSHGGHINSVNQSNGDVTVVWSDVDATGFGVLTFTPEECKIDCLLPTSIRIPVIKTIGTIVGSDTICQGEQGLYQLPQWPSTDFHWEIIGDPTHTMIQLIPTDQRNQIAINALQNGVYVLHATYENTLLHCGGSADITITVGKPNNVRGPVALCKNSSATYTTSNGGLYDWVIKKGNAVVANATQSASITYTFAQAGSYTIGIDSTVLCTNTTLGVTVYELPSAPGSVTGDLIVCPNAPYSYTLDAPVATSNYHWQVLPAGSATFVGSAEGTSVNIRFNTAATHQILVTQESTEPISCVSDPQIINVVTKQINAAIALDATTNATVCANSYGQYKAVVTGIPSPPLYTEGEIYTWSLANPNPTTIAASSLGSITSGQGTNSVTVLWNNVLQTTTVNLHLEITKCTLPVKQLDFQVTIVPLPTLTIVGNPAVCSGFTANYSVTSNVTLDPSTIVSWNFGGVAVTGTLNQVMHQSLNSTFTNNIIRTVTASISACNQTITAAPLNVTVYPGPLATNSISFGGNSFCTEAAINTILSSATSSGATIQWYSATLPNPTAVGVPNSPTYSPTAYGNYYFVATNSNGCSTRSNLVSIFTCSQVPPCDLSAYSVTNTAANDCGVLTLQGTAPGTVQPIFWSILGPGINENHYTNSTIQAQAGVYHVYCVGTFPCPTGGTGLLSDYKEITVPYIPKFNYTATCNGNTNFTITVDDNSNFYNLVTDRVFEYYIDSGSGYPATPSFIGAIGTLGTSFGSGNYHIKLVIRGKINGAWQPDCVKEIAFPLQTLPAMTVTSTPTTVPCHDTAVGFALTPNLTPLNNTYLWSFDAGAQNTLATPSRVFTSSGSQPVNVVVTNKYGCFTNPALTTTVAIPAPCFAGTITATPASAEVCANGAVHLQFSSSMQNCPPASYVWMNGTTPMATTTGNGQNVYAGGFYWVKVKSANNCTFETANRITPLFKKGPSVKLQTASSYCAGDQVTATVDTNGTGITWYLNGAVQSAYNNSASASFGGLSVGTYTILVTAYLDGCTNSAVQSIIINPMPDAPQLSHEQISCDPFQQLVTVTGGAGNYTWSNGMSGDSNVVTNGGPIRVYSTLGGCRSHTDITIPKNPDNYTWSFPSGCYDFCDKEVVGTLIGPSVELTSWSWLFEGQPVQSGQNSFPTPFVMGASGEYNFAYASGSCEHLGQPLNYTLHGCEKCRFEIIEPREIFANETKYCSFTVVLRIVNAYGYPVTATLTSPDDLVVIQPSSFTVTPGSGDYFFTFVPINGFAGGALPLLLTSHNDKGDLCQNDFTINLPECKGNRETKTSLLDVASMLRLYPNPAKETVRIAYNSAAAAATLSVYDLTGRLMTSYVTPTGSGEWEVPLAGFASGVYVVVLEANNTIMMQQKLIKE